MSEYESYRSNDEEDQSQASFFNDESSESTGSYYTTIDPNDEEAVLALASMYSKEDLLEFFKSLRDSLPELLYHPGISYKQAMTYLTRMSNKTRIKRLADLGFNFDTHEFHPFMGK